jgi:hypothetical protein
MSEPAAHVLRSAFWEPEQQPADLYAEALYRGAYAPPADSVQQKNVRYQPQWFSADTPMLVIGNVYDPLQTRHEADPSRGIGKGGVQDSASNALAHGLLPDSASEITNATTTDDVISALRRRELDEVADRAAELSRLHEIDPDEPHLDVASLKEMAAAVVRNPKLRVPQLTISENGFMHAEWRTVEGGTVAMTFLPSGRVEFGAISAPAVGGAEILRLGGLHLQDVALNAVQWYTERIATP